MKNWKCVLCGDMFTGWGNNPYPAFKGDGKCCDDCNDTKVIPARLDQFLKPHYSNTKNPIDFPKE